jgi:hypothetical protein
MRKVHTTYHGISSDPKAERRAVDIEGTAPSLLGFPEGVAITFREHPTSRSLTFHFWVSK